MRGGGNVRLPVLPADASGRDRGEPGGRGAGAGGAGRAAGGGRHTGGQRGGAADARPVCGPGRLDGDALAQMAGRGVPRRPHRDQRRGGHAGLRDAGLPLPGARAGVEERAWLLP